MRIGIDAKVLKNNSGITRYLTSLLNCLQTIDNENEYFLFEQKPSNYSIVNSKWKKILIFGKTPGIIWQQLLLPIFLKKFKIDILWAPEQTCPIFLLKKIPILLTIHDFASIRFPETCQSSVVIISRLFLTKSIRRASFLLPVSNYIQKELEDRFASIVQNKRVVSITNASPDWKIPSSYSPFNREDYLFFVGNLEPRKNLMSVLLALEILYQKDFKNIKLYIAGPSGWKSKNFQSFLNKSAIKNNVKFLGFISDDELKLHYAQCKAFVFPSIYEGFGIPVLEALTLDCLVLTSKKTVMEEIAGEAAIYFDPNDPLNIAQVIKTVFNDSFSRDKYLSHAEQVIKNYTWKQSTAKLKTLFIESATYKKT